MNPIERACMSSIPAIYGNDLTLYETVCKLAYEVKELSDKNDALQAELNALESSIQDYIARLLDKWVADGTLAKILNDSLGEWWANPKWFGAKLDGVADDSSAVQQAMQLGNVKFPMNSKCYIGATVKLSNSSRIIDGNGCTLTGLNDFPMFQINELAATSVVQRVTFKNFYVDLKLSGSFMLCFNSYFVNFEKIRVMNAHSSEYGFKIVNGFNVTFRNVYVTGSSSNDPTISKNHAKGIIYTIDDTATIPGITNVTNVDFEDCLIQRVEYGLWLKREGTTGAFDTTTIRNIGFSSCDNAVVAESSIVNMVDINTIRTEFCGTAVSNSAIMSISDWQCWQSDYGILNSGTLKLSNAVYFRGATGNYTVIKNNTGVIDARNVSEMSVYPLYSRGTPGKIIKADRRSTVIVNSTPAIALSQWFDYTYDQRAYLDFKNINGDVGSRFNIYSSNGSDFLLPSGVYADNKYDLTGQVRMLECLVTENGIAICGSFPKYASVTNQGGVLNLGTNEAERIIEVQGNISSVYFKTGIPGMAYLYSKNGSTLSDGGSKLTPSVSSPINLQTNPCILIWGADGTGMVVKGAS